jgi:hypothetical protein
LPANVACVTCRSLKNSGQTTIAAELQGTTAASGSLGTFDRCRLQVELLVAPLVTFSSLNDAKPAQIVHKMSDTGGLKLKPHFNLLKSRSPVHRTPFPSTQQVMLALNWRLCCTASTKMDFPQRYLLGA